MLNIKCQTSNIVSDSSDQKLSVLPSLTKFWSFLDLYRYCLLLFYLGDSWKKERLPTFLKIQVSKNIMMADVQTDYLNDYWTNCKTVTQNLFGDSSRCYDLLYIPYGNFKPLICKMSMRWRVKHLLARENSLLMHLVLFNFRFEINMATLNNALQNFLTKS